MIQVYVGNSDMLARTLNVAIVNHIEDATGKGFILRAGESGTTWEPFEPEIGQDIEPTIRLPHEAGRALLDALAHHYQGTEDTRRLRADYDAALKRADDKDRVIADVVRTLAWKVGGE